MLVLFTVTIFHIRSMHDENRFLETFRGPDIRPIIKNMQMQAN